jgi:tetratricopeptide (TPR) repeat protein
MERWGECAEVFREGVRLCEQTGFARGLAGHLTNLGSCLIALSRIEEGREAVVRALAIREQMGDSMGVAQCLTALAHLALVNKDWRNARDLSQKALSLNRRIGYVLGERVALLNLGKALTGLDSPDEAERQFQACLLTAGRDRALTPAIGYAHQAIADLIEARGDREAALRHRLNAIVVFDKLEMYDRSERIRQMLGRPTPGVPLTASPARPERPTPRNTRPAAGRTTKPLPATGRTPTGRTSAAGGRPSGPRVTPISTTAVKSPEGGDGRGSDSRSPL